MAVDPASTMVRYAIGVLRGRYVKEKRRRECRHHSVQGDDLRVGADRDRRRHQCAGGRPQERRPEGDEVVETRPGDEREVPDPDADGNEDRTEHPVPAAHEPLAEHGDDDAGDEADDDSGLGSDPSPADGQAEEEQGAEQQGQPANPRQTAPADGALEVVEFQ